VPDSFSNIKLKEQELYYRKHFVRFFCPIAALARLFLADLLCRIF